MTKKYFSLITKIGLGQINKSLLPGAAKLEINQFAVGAGENNTSYIINENQTALKSEKYRAKITEIIFDANKPENLEIVVNIPYNIGGFTIREFAAFDKIGNLILLANIPESENPNIDEGAAAEYRLHVLFQATNLDQITFNISSSDILANKQYVDKKITDHQNNPDPHPKLVIPSATTIIEGKIEIATIAETVTGSSHKLAITPKTLKYLFDNLKNSVTSLISNATPAGVVTFAAGNSAPAGYLECNGAYISKTAYAALYAYLGGKYGTSGNRFKLPDYRNQFFRGANGRGVGSTQWDSLGSHNHLGGRKNYKTVGAAYGKRTSDRGMTSHFSNPVYERFQHYTSSTGGSETRPRNIAVLTCIKY